MKTLNEFKEFYYNTLTYQLEKVESTRRETLRFIVIVNSIAIIVSISLVLLLYVFDPKSFLASTGLLVPLLYFFLYAVFPMSIGSSLISAKNYHDSFKSRIISQLALFFDPDSKYFYYSAVDSNYFIDSKLFFNLFTDVGGEDYVSSKIGSTSTVFSFVTANRNTEIPFIPVKVFKGYFLVADFNKNFLGKTFVLPDNTENFLGYVSRELQDLDILRGQLVSLEDPEFELLYKVYSDSQITARCILTTKLMQSIAELTERFGKKIRISFIDSKLYVAIPYSRNCLDPKFLQPMNDFGTAFEYYEFLQLIFGVVNELNLNKNIWNEENRF